MNEYLITFKNGRTKIVKGKVYLFCESNPSFPLGQNVNVFNAGAILSVQEQSGKVEEDGS